MRMGWAERRVVGVRLRIIPIQLVFSAPDFVSVTINQHGQTIEEESFPDDQLKSAVKMSRLTAALLMQ